MAVEEKKLSAQQPFQAFDAGGIRITFGRAVVERENAGRFDGIKQQVALGLDKAINSFTSILRRQLPVFLILITCPRRTG
jgi:hypothetical protein